MSNILHEAMRLIQDSYNERVFVAVVSSKNGNQVHIRRPGKVQTEGPYPTAQGIAAGLTIGDRVKCQRVGGTVLVEYRIAT